MPRNSSGIMTLPAGNPVVPGTLIESTWANPTMSDLANEITQSLPRNGSAGMTGPLMLARDGQLSLEAVTYQQLQNSVNGNNSYLPAGAIQAFASSTIPTGWLECNGAAVSRSTYSNLFNVIGTTYGAGNGSTTFNLPDLRGEFIRGWDNGRNVDPGRAFGSNQAGANALHSHGGTTGSGTANHTHTGSTTSSGAHIHTIDFPYAQDMSPGSPNGYFAAKQSQVDYGIETNSSGNHSHTFTTSAASDTAHTHPISGEGTEARPRNVAMVYCIKAFGALQTDGLGSMAFQNKELVDITGGSGRFETLQSSKVPVSPNDVLRLADASTIGGGGVGEITSADTDLLGVYSETPGITTLVPYSNQPNGMLKLDSSGYIQAAQVDQSKLIHGLLSGLTSDDHPQYLNSERAEAVYEKLNMKGVADGYTPLNGSTLVPASHLPFTDLSFVGTWSAASGELPPAPNNGDLWIISEAGMLSVVPPGADFPPQSTAMNVGDLIVFGTTQQCFYALIPNTATTDARYLQLTGGTLTGPLIVPAGATGTQVPQAGEVGSLVSTTMNDHTSATDPHPQYLNIDETNVVVDGKITTHVAEPNPHPQYLTVEQGGTAAKTSFTPYRTITATNVQGAIEQTYDIAVSSSGGGGGSGVQTVILSSDTQIISPDNSVANQATLNIMSNQANGLLKLGPDGYIQEAQVDQTKFVHSRLSGLSADDHPQYFNSARGDATYEKLNMKGVANGYVPLNGSTLVSMEYLPLTNMSFVGTWDASGGTLPPDPNNGDVWVISVAGTIEVVPPGGDVPPVPTPVETGDLIVYGELQSAFYLLHPTFATLDARYLQLTGGEMWGPIIVPAGATGTQVPQRVEVDTAISAAVSAHVAANNPHPEYATDADVDTIASGKVSDHVNSATPHAQYEGKLSLTGGTMTGELLTSVAQSLADNSFTRKDYVDALVAGGGGGGTGDYLPLTGGTLTGPLTLEGGTGTGRLTINAANGAYSTYMQIDTTNGDFYITDAAADCEVRLDNLHVYKTTVLDDVLYARFPTIIGTDSNALYFYDGPSWQSSNVTGLVYAYNSGGTKGLALKGGPPGSNATVTLSQLGLTCEQNITAYSDARLKDDVQKIPDALNKVSAIGGYTFLRNDSKFTKRKTGVIAQEVQKVLPEAVFDPGDDGFLSVDYGSMVGLLIEAIKELRTEVESLRKA